MCRLPSAFRLQKVRRAMIKCSLFSAKVRPFSGLVACQRTANTFKRVTAPFNMSSSSSCSVQLQQLEDTLLVHVGLFGCFHNPTESCTDYKICNMHMRSFYMRKHTGDHVF